MTDRELLELAAKVAGMSVGVEPAYTESGRYDLYWSLVHHQLCWHGKTAGSEYPEPVFWNPLTDDGDALRLAVKCGICFGPNLDGDRAVAYGEDGRNIVELHGDDPYAATRRAIVRAAAEIGRTME